MGDVGLSVAGGASGLAQGLAQALMMGQEERRKLAYLEAAERLRRQSEVEGEERRFKRELAGKVMSNLYEGALAENAGVPKALAYSPATREAYYGLLGEQARQPMLLERIRAGDEAKAGRFDPMAAAQMGRAAGAVLGPEAGELGRRVEQERDFEKLFEPATGAPLGEEFLEREAQRAEIGRRPLAGPEPGFLDSLLGVLSLGAVRGPARGQRERAEETLVGLRRPVTEAIRAGRLSDEDQEELDRLLAESSRAGIDPAITKKRLRAVLEALKAGGPSGRAAAERLAQKQRDLIERSERFRAESPFVWGIGKTFPIPEAALRPFTRTNRQARDDLDEMLRLRKEAEEDPLLEALIGRKRVSLEEALGLVPAAGR